MKREIAIIAGPTAVGKTKYSIDYALENNGEIVSCDSMQLYKYMNIGTAKPTSLELSKVKHYLIDSIDPREDFSVAIYQKLAKEAIETIFEKGKTPVISGGTGLYLNSLIYRMDFGEQGFNWKFRENIEAIAKEKGKMFVHGMLQEKDKESAERIHPNNLRRVIRALEAVELSGKPLTDFKKVEEKTTDYTYKLYGLTRERECLYERINTRVDQMIAEGLVQEVKDLTDRGFSQNSIAMKGIGYKELMEHLRGEFTLLEAIDLIKKNTRHYAKRQLTWFRRYEEMEWIIL